jgi:hypothetical protein
MNTALVPVEVSPRERVNAPEPCRPRADFVAHLIAMAVRAPQTLLRRRCDPEDALAAYRALGHWPTLPGRILSRSL